MTSTLIDGDIDAAMALFTSAECIDDAREAILLLIPMSASGVSWTELLPSWQGEQGYVAARWTTHED